MRDYVLVLCPEFGFGGIGNHTSKIVNYLLDEGVQVCAYAIKNNANRSRRSFIHSNFDIVEITWPIAGFETFNPLFDILSYLHYRWKKKPSLIIRSLPPYYIHVPWISNKAIPELAISHCVRKASIRIDNIKRKLEVKEKFILSGLGEVLIKSEKMMLHKAKRIVAVSEYTKRQLQNYHKVKKEKIEVIYNSVDTSLFRRKKNTEIKSEIGKKIEDFKDNSYLTVFVGRPTPWKNIGLLHDIIMGLSSKKDHKFVIVGMDGNDKHVKFYDWGSNSDVLFLGYIDNNLLPDVYSLSEFLLMTSYDENIPTVLLEAMACGTIPISTNVGGIPEVIKDKKNGFLVSQKKDDFLNTIHYLTSCDKRTLNVISRNAEKKVKEKFSLEIMKKKFLDTINEIISI